MIFGSKLKTPGLAWKPESCFEIFGLAIFHYFLNVSGQLLNQPQILALNKFTTL